MTEQELYNEYRKSDCKSFTDFLISKITELKKTYRKQRNKRIDELQKENAELKEKYVKECEDVMYVVTNYTKQLTKAKEIIKKLIALNRKEWIYSDVREEAEQFIKDSEV